MSQPPTEPLKPCRACGQAIDGKAQTCPQCNADQAPSTDPTEGLRPLGPGAPAPPASAASTPSDPPARAPAPTRGPAPRPEPSPDSGGPQPRHREGSFLAYVQDQWREDRWFAVLLGLIVLQAALALITGDLMGLVVAGVVLWGLLTYNFWVYVIMVIVVGFDVVYGGILLITGQLALAALPGLGINVFILAVLLRRHEQYM